MVSTVQIAAMIDFLEENPELALGRINRTKEGRSVTKRLWTACSTVLNSIASDCVQKTPDQWRMYYNEYKSKVLKKIKSEKTEFVATGGGPPKKIVLTPLQDRLYNILGRDVGEPLPGVRHNPISQIENEHQLAANTANALNMFPDNIMHEEHAREDSIIIYREPFEVDLGDHTGHQPESHSITSQESVPLASLSMAAIRETLMPQPIADSSQGPVVMAGSSQEPVHMVGSSQEPAPVVRNRQAQPDRAPLPPQRRRRRPQTNSQTITEPAMREATESLATMERLNSEATREHAVATREQAVATNRLASAIELLAERLREMSHCNPNSATS